MVLPKGPFWEHVEETTDGTRKWKCKFCGQSFAKQTPITRFKFHWSRVPSHGTKICEKVPEPVRKAARKAVFQKTELRTTSSSSNNRADNAISTALQEQNDQVENAVTDEATSLPSQLYSEGQLNSCLEGIRELVNREASVSCAPETTSGTEQVGQESQRNTCDISPLSMEDYVVDNTNVQEAAFLAMHGGKKRQKTIASSSNVNDNDISQMGTWPSGGRGLLPSSAPGFEPHHVHLSPPRCLTCPLSLQDVQWTRGIVEVRVSWPGHSGYQKKNDNDISSCPQVENNEVDNLAGDAGGIQITVQGTEQGAGEGRTSSRDEAGNLMENMAGGRIHIGTSITAEELIVDAHETRGEASQAPDVVEKYQEVGVEFSSPTQALLCNMFRGAMETDEEDRVPERSMDDAPQSGERAQQVGQLLEQIDGVDNLAGDGGRIRIEVQGMEQGTGEERSSSHFEAANGMENTSRSLAQPVKGSISPQRQEENTEVDNLARDARRIQMAAQVTERGVREGRNSSYAEAGNHIENMAGEMMHIDTSITAEGLIVDADETGGEAEQATDLVENHQEVRLELSLNYQELTNGLSAVPGWSMDDALESGQRTEQVGQLLEQSIGVDNLAGDGGRIQMGVQGMEPDDAHETRGEASQPLSPGAPACIDSITKLILDAPETRPRTEQVRRESEVGTCDLLSSCMEDRFATNDVENPATGSLQHFERGSSHEWLSRDSSQPTDLLCLGPGRDCDQLCSSSLNNDVILNGMENMVRELGHPVVRGSSHERLTVNQDEPRGDSSQPTDLLCFTLGGCYDQPRTPSVANDVIMNDVENMVRVSGQPVMRDASHEGLQQNGDESRGDAFPTKNLVGGEFEKNKNTIWSWLMDDEVSSIGIYGMGGVGKTTLVTHIYNQLLKRRDTFHHVYWITVSQDFSINRLQNSIAKRVGFDLSNEEEEPYRSVTLSAELMNRQKWVLILDDLWNSFELHKVGIPVQVKGCKVILTTRLEKVCKQMDCQKKIKVKPLSKVEAWTLFMEKLGHDISLSRQLKNIAQSITEECAGLPLGIVTMAGAMKGVDDICEWKNALEDLRQSRSRQDDMEEEVFRILRFSYMHLKDSAQQQCFLYCALFPEDFEILRDDLIAYLIDEGVIKGLESREEEFNKGHSMLNRLENVCLLESVKKNGDGRYVKMHDLIRDMAIQMQQGNFEVMVKAGARLKQLPDAEKWTENLLRVSLMQNQIEVIPSSYSPRCPNLSTLLLCSNQNLRFIENNFFKEMHGLKVLDLSHTNIEILPDSVFDLVSLISLLLSNCQNLRHVPSLKNLKRLKTLDLSDTALEKVPQGMECLSNLRYLRLNDCGEKEFPIGILPQLSHLQVLIIEEPMDEEYTAITVKGKEVACLRKLEILGCHFEGHSDFVEYFKSPDHTQSLSRYHILVGVLDEDYESWIDDVIQLGNSSKKVWLGNFSIRGDLDISFFPSDIEELIIFKWNDARSFCDVFSLAKAKELKAFTIMHCSVMESFVPSSWFCAAPPPSPSNVMFCSLTDFQCSNCRSMKKLFPLFLLPNLANLKEIRVIDCENMEEIIAAGRDEEGVRGAEFSLPKLKAVSLSHLPELKSICSAKLRCDSLKIIEVWDCEKLKRLPICLPLLDNGQPSKTIANLREIDVEGCDKMEEIIAGRDEEGVTGEEISLPKLESLKLSYLPELKTICSAKLRCDSLEKIEVWHCKKLKRLPICLPLLDNGQPSKRIANLREIDVEGCDKMEEIIAGRDEEGVTGEEISLPKLEYLKLSNLPELKSICGAKLRCDSLKIIEVRDCQKLKRMPICLPLLDNGQPSKRIANLREIDVGGCEKMEEIIAGRDEEGVTGEEISLPKLESLQLSNLPELKSICSAKLRCDSLKIIKVRDCQKLKRMPICLPLLDNGQPSPPPSLRRIEINPGERLESLEWEHPNAKDVLRPFVWFWDPTNGGYLRPG